LVIHLDGVGGILRLGAGARDYRRYGNAGAVHRVAREHWMRRNLHVRQHL
jgi:hypothetical protein